MKKWVMAIMSILIILCLSACVNTEIPQNEGNATSETTQNETTGSETNNEDADQKLKEELQAEADAREVIDYDFHVDTNIACGDYTEAYVEALAFERTYDDGSFASYRSRDYLNHLSVEGGEVVYDGWEPDSNFDSVKEAFTNAKNLLMQGNLTDGYATLQKAEDTGTDSCIMDYIDRMLSAFTLDDNGNPTAFDPTLGIYGEHIDTMYLDSVETPETDTLSAGDTFEITFRVYSIFSMDTQFIPVNDYYDCESESNSLNFEREGDYMVFTYAFDALSSQTGVHPLLRDTIELSDSWGNTLTIDTSELGFPEEVTIG